jgi:hypothetical protein
LENILEQSFLRSSVGATGDLSSADDEDQCPFEVLDEELEPVDVLEHLVEISRQFFQFGGLLFKKFENISIVGRLYLHLFFLHIHLRAPPYFLCPSLKQFVFIILLLFEKPHERSQLVAIKFLADSPTKLIADEFFPLLYVSARHFIKLLKSAPLFQQGIILRVDCLVVLFEGSTG